MEPDWVALDTSVLVGLIDDLDVWHAPALALRGALQRRPVEIFYFDCVINEVVSVLARRSRERKRSTEFAELLDKLISLVPKEKITWISGQTESCYPRILALIRDTEGALNFHDALIALSCQELGIRQIASFDQDFDLVPWLERLSLPQYLR